ncbi:MAG: hypothetical protein ACRDOX_01740 [Nocardioides sp.]
MTDARLALVLDAAAAPAEPGPAPGEEAALAAFRASSVRADGWRSRMNSPTTPRKALGVAAASAGLLLTGGFAAAAAGELPRAAQQTAHDMLATINVEVPGADEHSDGHADTRGRSEDAPPVGGGADAADTGPEAAAHGQMISDLARSTELEGVDKGMAISAEARSHGQAGQHGPAQAPAQSAKGGDDARAPEAATAAAGSGGQSGDHARVEAPNDGGTGTADGASADEDGGAPATNGTGTAAEMSGGRSTAGSGNAH